MRLSVENKVIKRAYLITVTRTDQTMPDVFT